MASRMPISKQQSILSIVIQAAIIALAAFGFYQIDRNYYLFEALISFIVVFTLLRYTIPHDHRKGVSLYKKEKYSDAVPYFEKSYIFFTKHKWIDKYRIVTLLSSSKVSYTEMALLNKAFCLAQLGNKTEAIEIYKKAIEQFPGSKMAEIALKMLK